MVQRVVIGTPLGFRYVKYLEKFSPFSRKPVMCYGAWRRWGPVTSNVAAILAAILDFNKIENLAGTGDH